MTRDYTVNAVEVQRNNYSSKQCFSVYFLKAKVCMLLTFVHLTVVKENYKKGCFLR